MNPISSNARNLGLYLALWVLAGLPLAMALVALRHVPWGLALLFALPLSAVFGFIAASAYYVCQSQPMPRRYTVATLAAFASASLLSGVLWSALCQAWNQVAGLMLSSLGLGNVAEGQLLDLPAHQMALLVWLGSALYLGSLLVHDLLIAMDLLRQTQEREAQSRLHAREAELQVLRSQINPHFLFNSLNSISALTTLDAAAARAMTLELAGFFRRTLLVMQQEKISLADEWALCQHFLAVERIRYGQRLQTDVELQSPALTGLIPPMLLQPCLENAIKHGVQNNQDATTLRLRAWVQGTRLFLTLHNPVEPDARAAAGTGTGLVNLQRRLQAVYGDQARLSWQQTGASFQLEMVLPFETPENHEH